MGIVVKQAGLAEKSCGYPMRSLKQFSLSPAMVMFSLDESSSFLMASVLLFQCWGCCFSLFHERDLLTRVQLL